MPILFVQARADPWTDLGHVREIWRRAPSPKQFLMLQEPMGRFDTYNYFGDHPELMLEFLEKNM